MLSRLLPLLALVAAFTAHAEKADRSKPMVFTADKEGRLDSVNQRTELVGNVIITQGSLVLRAEKVDVRETREGYHLAHATGAAGKPVSFRQARDVPGQAIEGTAEQLEYDTRTETVRFIGNAMVRSLAGTAVTNEVTGAVITYNGRTEEIKLDAGSSSPNPSGRVRMIRMPPPAEAASAPASGAALPLRPTTTITPPRQTP